MKKSLLGALALLIFSTGCALKPTRFVFREDGSDVYYLSKEKLPFKATIHGIDWKVQQVQDNTIVLSRSTPFPIVINIYEYNEGMFDRRFFKTGFTDGQSLKEYAEAEFKYYKSRGQAPQVVSENMDGPIKPNLLWSFTSANGSKVYNVSTAKDDHLITISYQSPKPTAQDELLAIFHSIKPITRKEADKLIETVEDKSDN
jgi:hypothetical protein